MAGFVPVPVLGVKTEDAWTRHLHYEIFSPQATITDKILELSTPGVIASVWSEGADQATTTDDVLDSVSLAQVQYLMTKAGRVKPPAP